MPLKSYLHHNNNNSLKATYNPQNHRFTDTFHEAYLKASDMYKEITEQANIHFKVETKSLTELPAKREKLNNVAKIYLRTYDLYHKTQDRMQKIIFKLNFCLSSEELVFATEISSKLKNLYEATLKTRKQVIEILKSSNDQLEEQIYSYIRFLERALSFIADVENRAQSIISMFNNIEKIEDLKQKHIEFQKIKSSFMKLVGYLSKGFADILFNPIEDVQDYKEEIQPSLPENDYKMPLSSNNRVALKLLQDECKNDLQGVNFDELRQSMLYGTSECRVQGLQEVLAAQITIRKRVFENLERAMLSKISTSPNEAKQKISFETLSEGKMTVYANKHEEELKNLGMYLLRINLSIVDTYNILEKEYRKLQALSPERKTKIRAAIQERRCENRKILYTNENKHHYIQEEDIKVNALNTIALILEAFGFYDEAQTRPASQIKRSEALEAHVVLLAAKLLNSTELPQESKHKPKFIKTLLTKMAKLNKPKYIMQKECRMTRGRLVTSEDNEIMFEIDTKLASISAIAAFMFAENQQTVQSTTKSQSQEQNNHNEKIEKDARKYVVYVCQCDGKELNVKFCFMKDSGVHKVQSIEFLKQKSVSDKHIVFEEIFEQEFNTIIVKLHQEMYSYNQQINKYKYEDVEMYVSGESDKYHPLNSEPFITDLCRYFKMAGSSFIAHDVYKTFTRIHALSSQVKMHIGSAEESRIKQEVNEEIKKLQTYCKIAEQNIEPLYHYIKFAALCSTTNTYINCLHQQELNAFRVERGTSQFEALSICK